MKTLLTLLLLIPSFSWGNLNFDNFYEENKYELKSIAHCKGFLQGIVDIFDFLDNEHSEDVIANSSEEEIEEFRKFQTELNNFEVGVISIEQNEGSYVLPPGIVRENLQGSTTVQQQNE